MKKSLYYRSENTPFDMGAFFQALLLGLLVSVPLAVLYDYAIIWIPIIYLNALSVVFFAFALGFVISKVFYRSKVRHMASVMILGAIVAIVAWYFSWVFWISYYSSESFFPPLSTLLHYLSSPADLFRSVLEVNAMGTWGISRGDTVNGLFLWIIWIIEALVLLVGTIIFSRNGLDEPFSEEDDDRYDQRDLATLFAPLTIERKKKKLITTEENELIARLESGDFSDLVPLGESDYEGQEYVTITLYSDKMKKSFYVTITEYRTTSQDNELEASPLVTYLSVDPEKAKIFERD